MLLFFGEVRSFKVIRGHKVMETFFQAFYINIGGKISTDMARANTFDTFGKVDT